MYGEMVRGRDGVDEVVTALLRFGDVTAELACSFRSEHQGLEAIGTQASLYVPDPWHARASVIVVDGREERVAPTSSYRLELENFSAAIRGEAEPLLGRDDALGQARVLDAIVRSAETHDSVALPQ